MERITGREDTLSTEAMARRVEDITDDLADLSPATWPADLVAERAMLERVLAGVGDPDGRRYITLIRENWFTGYIRDMYLDGVGPELHRYNSRTRRYEHVPPADLYRMAPFRHIDWDAVAAEERSDYTEVTIGDVVYLYLAP